MLPKNEPQYALDTDASGNQIECVYMQIKENERYRLADYWFFLLDDKGLKLATAHGDCLEVVRAPTLLDLYFERTILTVQNDHEAP